MQFPKRCITVAAIETAFIIPRFHSGASLSETGSSQKLYEPSLRFARRRNYTVLHVYINFAARRATPLLRCCGVSWKRRWKRVLLGCDRCFLSSHHLEITFDILDISRNAAKLISAHSCSMLRNHYCFFLTSLSSARFLLLICGVVAADFYFILYLFLRINAIRKILAKY